VDSDSDKIGRLRERFDGQGIYGTRVALIEADLLELPLPPYFASLIVSEDLSAAGPGSGQRFAAMVFHSLRPYGGVACLRLPPGQRGAFEGWVAAAGLANAVVTREGEYTALRREGALPGSADWTHQYADVANTGASKDELVRAPLGLLWFGGSSNLSILPRHGHGPSEHVVAGRLYIEGPESLRAMDVYTGRVLWERELPGLGAPYDNTSHQPGANALGSNYASATDGIYVAHGQGCLKLDPASGETVSELTLPPTEGQNEPQAWGYLGIYGDLLIAGASPIVFDGEQPMGRMDNWDGTSSKQIVAMDRQSGEVKWALESEYGFRHNAICAGGGKVFCVDRLPDAVVAKVQRRGEEVKMEPRLTALDVRSGEVLWSTTENVFGTWLSYSEEHDLLLQAGRRSRDMLGDEPERRMICYRGADGTVVWDRDDQYGGPPLLHGDTIITQGQAFGLLDGEPRTRRNPLTGTELPWQFQRMYGCNTAVASQHLLTFRSGAAGFFDLAGDGGTGNLGGFKSGCTSNLIVANGVLNAPDYTRTCTCSYQNQTSLAFVHMPEVEMWTFSTFEMGEEPIERIGINLGAPGDRREEDGTLWLELPGGGSPSPEVSVRVEPEEVRWLRRHSSAIEGEGLAWVGASGGEGLRSVSVALAKEGAVARDYAVTLYFAEIGGMKAGERAFDVAIQGERALQGLDIVKGAGGPNRVMAMEFRDVAVTDELTVTLRAVRGETLLCGIKAVAEG
jgi:outer membrane protein assembly factor BamB